VHKRLVVAKLERQHFEAGFAATLPSSTWRQCGLRSRSGRTELTHTKVCFMSARSDVAPNENRLQALAIRTRRKGLLWNQADELDCRIANLTKVIMRRCAGSDLGAAGVVRRLVPTPLNRTMDATHAKRVDKTHCQANDSQLKANLDDPHMSP
jgi:hypothetical protein